jgi:receptor protein-tyrosine kinase
MDVSKNEHNNASSELSVKIYISDFWRGLVKFWWFIALLALLCGGLMFYRSFIRFNPMYQSSVTFTVHTENAILEGESGLSAYAFYYDRNTADQLARVFPYIMQSNILQKQVCEDLDMSYMPASVSVYCVPGTNMVTLTTTGSDPEQTYDVMLAVLDNYSTVAEYIIGRTKLVMITNPQVPTEPYNSHAWKSATLNGVKLGLVLGIAFIILYAVLRETVRTKEDIRNSLNQHCMGVLPHVVFKRYRKKKNKNILLNNSLIGNQFLESVRLLRSAVQNALGADEKVIVVTSSAAGEGKSVTVLNLAAMFAKNEMRTLVIDGDLRESGICQMLSLEDQKFREKVRCDKDSFFAITHVDSLGVDLLRFDGAPKNFRKIMRTTYLRGILEDLRKQYDLIIIDSPPCGLISDAEIFGAVSDAVLYVIRQDYATAKSIRTGINTLLSTDVRLLGCVLNGATSGLGSYGYNYGYGYGYGYGYYGYRRSSYRYGDTKRKRSRKKVVHEETE